MSWSEALEIPLLMLQLMIKLRTGFQNMKGPLLFHLTKELLVIFSAQVLKVLFCSMVIHLISFYKHSLQLLMNMMENKELFSLKLEPKTSTLITLLTILNSTVKPSQLSSLNQKLKLNMFWKNKQPKITFYLSWVSTKTSNTELLMKSRLRKRLKQQK